MKNKNNDDFDSVNLRRERLQVDLDKSYSETINEEIEKLIDNLRGLQGALNGKEEHVNVLFEQQKEAAKETGKPASPENVKKVIDEFYEDTLKLDSTEEQRKILIRLCNRKNLMDDFEILGDLDAFIEDDYYTKELSPKAKYEVQKVIKELINRAFDAGIVAGVVLREKSLLKNK